MDLRLRTLLGLTVFKKQQQRTETIWPAKHKIFIWPLQRKFVILCSGIQKSQEGEGEDEFSLDINFSTV